MTRPNSGPLSVDQQAEPRKLYDKPFRQFEVSFKKLDRRVRDEYLWENANKRLKQEAVSSSSSDDEAGPSGSDVSE